MKKFLAGLSLGIAMLATCASSWAEPGCKPGHSWTPIVVMGKIIWICMPNGPKGGPDAGATP